MFDNDSDIDTTLVDDLSEVEAKSLLKRFMEKTSTAYTAVTGSDQARNVAVSSQFVLEQKLGLLAIDGIYNGSMMLAPVVINEWINKYPIAEPVFKAVAGATFSSLLTYGRHQVSEQYRSLIGPLERGCMHGAMSNLTGMVNINTVMAKLFSGAEAKNIIEQLQVAEALNKTNTAE